MLIFSNLTLLDKILHGFVFSREWINISITIDYKYLLYLFYIWFIINGIKYMLLSVIPVKICLHNTSCWSDSGQLLTCVLADSSSIRLTRSHKCELMENHRESHARCCLRRGGERRVELLQASKNKK